MKKTLLKTFYNLGAFAPFHRTTRGKVLILMYHRFSPTRHPAKTSAKELAAHLAYLKKHNRVISLSDAVDSLQNEKPLPDGATVITIDDGYADAFDVAFPVLKKFDTPATLFAVTDFLDRKRWLWTDLMRYVLSETKLEEIKIGFEKGEKVEVKLNGAAQKSDAASRLNANLKKLPNEIKESKIREIAAELNVEIPETPTEEFAPISWNQAREMDANKLSIESHTKTHPILTNIGATELDSELQSSKERLETMLDRPIEHFCYPNGSFDQTIAQAVEKNTYKSAVTTDYGFNQKDENLFTLRRVGAAPAIENFAQSVSGFEFLRQRN